MLQRDVSALEWPRDSTVDVAHKEGACVSIFGPCYPPSLHIPRVHLVLIAQCFDQNMAEFQLGIFNRLLENTNQTSFSAVTLDVGFIWYHSTCIQP